MTNRLIQLIQERIGSIASGFNGMEPVPLRELKGPRKSTTPLYQRLSKRQGIYFILQNRDLNSVVYVGRTSDGKTENGLADRLWGHMYSNSKLRHNLKGEPYALEDCFVVTLDVSDKRKRIRLEHFFIGVFNPVANVG